MLGLVLDLVQGRDEQAAFVVSSVRDSFIPCRPEGIARLKCEANRTGLQEQQGLHPMAESGGKSPDCCGPCLLKNAFVLTLNVYRMSSLIYETK